jgi:hypothetical protein
VGHVLVIRFVGADFFMPNVAMPQLKHPHQLVRFAALARPMQDHAR